MYMHSVIPGLPNCACCQPRAEQSNAKLFPLPVGDSSKQYCPVFKPLTIYKTTEKSYVKTYNAEVKNNEMSTTATVYAPHYNVQGDFCFNQLSRSLRANVNMRLGSWRTVQEYV